jgi:hypothetical protein
MNVKVVKLLLLSALFFALLFVTPMFATSVLKADSHAKIEDNLTYRPATEGQRNTILMGDPVDGGTP